MDWSRTKTILIWAFLLLDLFLGYQVYVTRISFWNDQDVAQGDKWDMELYLKQQNIALVTEVPQDTPEMSYLNAEYVGINPLSLQEMSGLTATMEKMSLAAKLNPPLPIRGQITPNELLRQIGPRLMYADQYTADMYQSNQGRLLYWQVYQKMPVFVAPLEVYLENGSILGYRQTFFHMRKQENGRQVISGYTALRSLVDKQIIQPGERIESVSLGYYGSYDADIQALAPVWRVIHEGKQHFINAFTGALERPMVTQR
ncbi:two-component system regulatory protein YycI [Brevibacillus choshinensis]|uniref:two-component system regulatory protein YycI n=1 Tax=Brevibacillus choshinensis TaxID=54911 RepID=UPI002E2071DC|nr:two-component system regulatory protein YycI [Brevibacillus choshinensis]MED4583523.1 two-component system regulatory protein YycI [Brevibacillus choshinensis]MED4751763.1 two-component system regulatory protein YycI [Brevibacillus choshinensis]MED4779995.1 two-component system regulatory protein YycI [Brevibacillus choshinensis]